MVQIYENYWKLTLAWTDFNDRLFLTALEETIRFIDNNDTTAYSSELYQNLQSKLSNTLYLEGPSLRKGINQLVKLGFINYHLASYHPLAKEYIKKGITDAERQFILSRIMYSNASFNRSVNEDSNINEVNFFVKTLEQCKSINENLLGAIMTVDISLYPAGYIKKSELELISQTNEVKEFIQRKYNQIAYLGNVLKKLNGISYIGKVFYLEKDAEAIQSDEVKEKETIQRDSYLQRLYKQQLQKESQRIFGKVKCMVEKLEYPVLIASHIKPYRYSNDDEAFDPNNGLLLSKTLDSLFDLNYISFDNDGTIIFYSRVPEDVKKFWQDYRLDNRFITPKRLTYLAYHRDMCEHINS